MKNLKNEFTDPDYDFEIHGNKHLQILEADICNNA